MQLTLNFQPDSEPTGEMTTSLSLVGSRNYANLTALQEAEKERTTTAHSGLKCLERSGSAVQLGLLAKTLLASSAWHSPAGTLKWKVQRIAQGWIVPSTASSTTSKKRAILSKRLLFRLVPSERPTDGTGFGSLLSTPSANPMGDITPEQGEKNGWEWRGTAWYRADGSKVQTTLGHQVVMLPTPNTTNAKNGHKSLEDGRMQRKISQGWTIDLHDMATTGLLATPTTQDAKNATLPQSQALLDSVPGNLLAHGITGRLNPRFVAEMMGFPPDWLELPFQCAESVEL